jgi:hypothetical protein
MIFAEGTLRKEKGAFWDAANDFLRKYLGWAGLCIAEPPLHHLLHHLHKSEDVEPIVQIEEDHPVLPPKDLPVLPLLREDAEGGDLIEQLRLSRARMTKELNHIPRQKSSRNLLVKEGEVKGSEWSIIPSRT